MRSRFGWFLSILIRRKIKKRNISRLQTGFRKQMDARGFDGNADLFFEHFIKPKLLKKSLEILPAFEKLIALPYGIDLFLKAIESYEKQPSLASQKFKQILDLGMGAIALNREGVERALKTYPRVASMMAGRFTCHHELAYLETMLRVVEREPPLPCNESYLKKIEDFLTEMERIQAERPKIYSGIGQQQALSLYADVDKLFASYPFLIQVFRELLEMTVVLNTHLLQQAIRAFYQLPPIENKIPSLLVRCNEHDFTLSREIHPQCQLFEDGDEVIHFSAATQTYLTNEKTMETRSLIHPLPIAGELSKTEVRKLLHLLEHSLATPSHFDSLYEKLGLAQEARAKRKELFLNWIASLEQEIGKILFDFNATEQRPFMAFAQEISIVQAAIQDPKNEEFALKAAQLGNIFNVKGQLSLLPSELSVEHPAIAHFSPEELNQAFELLFAKKKKAITIALTKNRCAALSIKRTPIKIGKVQAMEIATTLQSDNKHYTRTTLYLVHRKETPQDRLSALVKSGHFCRDLLLAKSEAFQKII